MSKELFSRHVVDLAKSKGASRWTDAESAADLRRVNDGGAWGPFWGAPGGAFRRGQVQQSLVAAESAGGYSGGERSRKEGGKMVRIYADIVRIHCNTKHAAVLIRLT